MRMVYLQVSESLVGLERCTNTWTVHSQRTALPVGLSEARPVASSEFRSGGVEVVVASVTRRGAATTQLMCY